MMLRGMKCKLRGALVLCLVIGFSLTAQASSAARELNVQDAVTIALERNLAYQIATLDWQGATAKLERAHIVGDEEMLKEAKEEWEKAKEIYGDKGQALQDLVRSSYHQLLESETMVENARVAKERAGSQLAMDENKYKAGLLSSLDIDRAQNSLFDAEHRYEKAVTDLETQRMKFNEILGLPLDEKTTLTEGLLLDFVPFTLNLETCYDLALELDPEMLSAKDRLEKAKEAVLIAQSPFTPRVELEQALVDQEKAEIGVKQAQQALYFTIRADDFSLSDQAHGLEVAERNIELERQALKAEESKYAAGVLSNAQIVAQQEKLAALEQQYSADLSSYTLARIKLLQTIGRHEELGEGHVD